MKIIYIFFLEFFVDCRHYFNKIYIFITDGLSATVIPEVLFTFEMGLD
jgi:hypothetical protein